MVYTELEARPSLAASVEQVQQKLGGTTLRRFIEATDPQPLEALQAFPHKMTLDRLSSVLHVCCCNGRMCFEEDDDLEAEMQVLVQDMEGRRGVTGHAWTVSGMLAC